MSRPYMPRPSPGVKGRNTAAIGVAAAWGRGRALSLPVVREELAVERDAHPRAGVRFASLEREVEGDRAHDAVAEILVNQRLERGPVHLQDLVEAVDRRIARRKSVKRAAGRDLLEHGGCVVGQLEEAAHSRGLLRAERMLPVQGGREPDAIRADMR